MTRGKGEGSWRTRPDGRLEYALPIGRTARGNTRRKSFYGASKKEILAQVESWRKTTFKQGALEPTGETLNEFFVRYLEHRHRVQGKISAFTRQDYAWRYDKYIAPNLGHLRLHKLDPAGVMEWQTKLIADGLGNRSLEYAHVLLKACLEFALQLRLIGFNPAASVPSPRHSKTEKRSYTKAETRAYLEVASTHRLEALFLLLFTTGLRRSEVLGLRWEDIDSLHLEINVRSRLRWKRGGGFDVDAPKTENSRRTIPIAGDVLVTLERWKRQQCLERQHAAGYWQDLGLVFTAEDGAPLYPTVLTKAHQWIAAQAGVRQLTIHELRHTFTSLARASGVDLKVISQTLGHATAAFTADFYQHTFDEQKRSVVRSRHDLIGEPINAKPVLLEKSLLEWTALVEWLERRPGQAQAHSKLPKRFLSLLSLERSDERQWVALIGKVRGKGWVLVPDYRARLEQLCADVSSAVNLRSGGENPL